MYDCLKTYAVVLSRECDFQVGMHQKLFVGLVLLGPARSSQRSHRLAGSVGRDPWDGEETQKGRKGGEEKVGKRKERKRKGRRGGERDKVPYRHSFTPLPALRTMYM